MEQTPPPPPHVAILPSPGMGHLIPLGEFAKRIVAHHNFTVSFIVPSFIVPTDVPLPSAQKAFLEALPEAISYVLLPPVNIDDLGDDAKVGTRISLSVVRSLPSLKEEFKSLVSRTKLVALVVDLFGTDAFDVAKEFDVSPYIFFPASSICLSLFLYLPKLDQVVTCEYRDLPEPVQIPGCVPLHGSDLLDPVQDRKNEAYKWVVHHTKRYRLADGILTNSFKDLECGAIGALQADGPGKPPVYAVGPLIQMDSSSTKPDDSGCLRWLDDQPRGSVLFISFGSRGSLPYEQFTELALGLEMSKQRFLWVVRSPSGTAANATYFSLSSKSDPLSYLPEGFLDRTKGHGLVLPSWAPQAQILSHPSTGGFLTHCGWNSTLESVVSGVPLIAWPLYAEQRMNAVILTEDVKVALRPKAGEKGIIGRLEIARVTKSLMEGEEGKQVRSRMRDLKDAAARMLSEDGDSTKALAEVARKWKSKISN